MKSEIRKNAKTKERVHRLGGARSLFNIQDDDQKKKKEKRELCSEKKTETHADHANAQAHIRFILLPRGKTYT